MVPVALVSEIFIFDAEYIFLMCGLISLDELEIFFYAKYIFF